MVLHCYYTFTQMLAKKWMGGNLDQADILPVVDGMLIFVEWFQDVPGLW